MINMLSESAQERLCNMFGCESVMVCEYQPEWRIILIKKYGMWSCRRYWMMLKISELEMEDIIQSMARSTWDVNWHEKRESAIMCAMLDMTKRTDGGVEEYVIMGGIPF